MNFAISQEFMDEGWNTSKCPKMSHWTYAIVYMDIKREIKP